jgi:Predicted nucleic acid-binding protein, contains PIN domain
MLLWDVNLWVYSFRADCPLHGLIYTKLSESLERRESFLFCPSVASSFLRLVTNPRIFVEPSAYAEAWAFIDYLESHPAAVYADADAMSFGIFKHIALVTRATGNTVPDAFLAALALRHDARLVTADSGMKRFEGVEVEIIA